jgi:hypothetical protein
MLALVYLLRTSELTKKSKVVINLDVTVTEKAKQYIAKASEIIAKNNEKPAIAIWAERIHA